MSSPESDPQQREAVGTDTSKQEEMKEIELTHAESKGTKLQDASTESVEDIMAAESKSGSDIADDEEDPEEELNSLDDANVKTGTDRNILYEKGTKLYRRGRQDLALKYLLRCITGLDETSGFNFLPQCVHHIADIYYEKGEYEKAIQFIQAEKMYYETALIDTSVLQKKVEEQKVIQENSSNDDDTKPEIARADEYETLAKLCLEKKQPHMALEYQGKATKLRQKVYGEDHPVTAKSLDFFTVIYGEVGRFQYSESMDKFKTEEPSETTDGTSDGNSSLTEPHSPHSILRSRSTSLDDTSKERKRKTSRVRFEEPPPDSSVRAARQEEEQSVARIVLMVVFFVLSVLLMFLLAFLYCKLDVHSKTCANWKLELHYYYMRFKYYYYYYTSSSRHTYG